MSSNGIITANKDQRVLNGLATNGSLNGDQSTAVKGKGQGNPIVIEDKEEFKQKEGDGSLLGKRKNDETAVQNGSAAVIKKDTHAMSNGSGGGGGGGGSSNANIEKMQPWKIPKLYDDLPIKTRKPHRGPSRLIPAAGSPKGLTPLVALDCEMVLVEGNLYQVARCSIVNYYGHVILDRYIKPTKRIVNFITWVSGIRFDNIKDCGPLEHYKFEIFAILKNRTIVGHSLHHDFKALGYVHDDERNIRDLRNWKQLNDKMKINSLKTMAEKHLKIRIQVAEHDSVEDARASMALYKMYEREWELMVREQYHTGNHHHHHHHQQ